MELLKQEQIFDELVNERRFEINKLREEINFNNLIYYYTGKSAPKYFIVLKDPIIIYNDIKKERRKNSRRISIRDKWNIKKTSKL